MRAVERKVSFSVKRLFRSSPWLYCWKKDGHILYLDIVSISDREMYIVNKGFLITCIFVMIKARNILLFLPENQEYTIGSPEVKGSFIIGYLCLGSYAKIMSQPFHLIMWFLWDAHRDSKCVRKLCFLVPLDGLGITTEQRDPRIPQ